MRTTALFFCLLAYSHAIASICRGAGKAFVPMVIMLLFWCVVRIAYITIVMGIVHEIQYIYMAYPITWSLSSIVYFLYYHFSDWVHGFDKKPAKPQETKKSPCSAQLPGMAIFLIRFSALSALP